MFETMQSFLCFFIPAALAIIAGILFEERLIAFEQRLQARFTARRRRRAALKRNARLQKLSGAQQTRQNSGGRSAA